MSSASHNVVGGIATNSWSAPYYTPSQSHQRAEKQPLPVPSPERAISSQGGELSLPRDQSAWISAVSLLLIVCALGCILGWLTINFLDNILGRLHDFSPIDLIHVLSGIS